MDKYRNYLFFAIYLVLNPRLLRLVGKVYLPTYIQYEWLKKYKIRTVVDVGAFRGDVSCSLHYLLPGVKIYAFEPLGKHLKILKNKISKENLVAEALLVSDINGEVSFFENEYAQASSLLSLTEKAKSERPFLANTKSRKVMSVTLDRYFERKKLPGMILLKVDAQGGEGRVIKGGRKFLKKVAFVHLETSFEPLYKGQLIFEDIKEMLDSLGFWYAGGVNDSDFYPRFGPKLRENSFFVNKRFVKGEDFYNGIEI